MKAPTAAPERAETHDPRDGQPCRPSFGPHTNYRCPSSCTSTAQPGRGRTYRNGHEENPAPGYRSPKTRETHVPRTSGCPDPVHADVQGTFPGCRRLLYKAGSV